MLVAAAGQGPDKDPGGKHFPDLDIRDLGTGAEVHLSGLPGGNSSTVVAWGWAASSPAR